jgi:hypothetical protein
MSEILFSKEKIFKSKLQLIIDNTLTDLFTESIESCIKNEWTSLSSFLSEQFRYWDLNWSCTNSYLKFIDKALSKFYKEYQRYPDSLNQLKLDISNLYPIVRNIMYLEKDELKYFKKFKSIRNFCSHLREIPEEDFKELCKEIEKIINECSYLSKERKLDYLEKVNYTMKNVDIVDKQVQAEKYDELNQKIAEMDIAINKNSNAIEKNTTAISEQKSEIRQIKQAISVTVVRYKENDYRVNIKLKEFLS